MTSFNPIKRSPLKPNFLCFLIVVAAIWLVRLGIFIRQVRFLSCQSTPPSDEPKIWAGWRTCWGHVQWMKQMTVLTALLSFLTASWQASVALGDWVIYKAGPIALAGAIAEVLRVFAFGILACTRRKIGRAHV